MLCQWNSMYRDGFCSVVMQQSWQYSLILIWYGWCSLYVWVWRSTFRCLWNHVAPWMLDCTMQMADEANYASLLCCESKKTSHRPARNFTKMLTNFQNSSPADSSNSTYSFTILWHICARQLPCSIAEWCTLDHLTNKKFSWKSTYLVM